MNRDYDNIQAMLDRHIPRPPADVRRTAQLVVARHAHDADDLADLLTMLGLK